MQLEQITIQCRLLFWDLLIRYYCCYSLIRSLYWHAASWPCISVKGSINQVLMLRQWSNGYTDMLSLDHTSLFRDPLIRYWCCHSLIKAQYWHAVSWLILSQSTVLTCLSPDETSLGFLDQIMVLQQSSPFPVHSGCLLMLIFVVWSVDFLHSRYFNFLVPPCTLRFYTFLCALANFLSLKQIQLWIIIFLALQTGRYSSDSSRQSTLTLRSRRRPRHPHHLYHHRHSSMSSQSPSPTRSRSRSRSRSRGEKQIWG